MKRQLGNTIIGFIVGVVIGLGAALAVAVYVTKVPVPFMNKGQNRTAEQDAAEARKNRDWDPNAPLYGKNPARPAQPPAVAGSAPGPAVAVPAVPAARASAAQAAKPPAVAGDPLGDLAKAKSAPGAADPFSYFVQIGAFRTAEDAEAQRAKLSLSGVEAKVTEREQSGRTVFRVRAGPFDRKEEADKMKERLESNGIEAALVRVQR